MKNGQLYTVCDDANSIFRLDFSADNTVEALVHTALDLSHLSVLDLDLEGITLIDDAFYVASESHHKLVRVDQDSVRWVPAKGNVYDSAFQAGLFQVYNAGIEAAVYLGNHKFLLSVERQPRGLIEVEFDDNFEKIISQKNQVFNDSSHMLESDRKPDLTGLYRYDGVIYALHRNAYMIHELIVDEHGLYHEGKSWSYEHIVKHPNHAYQDMQFGHAEGLVVDEDHFYLVIDNNNNPKLKNPNDARPLLIIAKRK